jgi:hypothetical protein
MIVLGIAAVVILVVALGALIGRGRLWRPKD